MRAMENISIDDDNSPPELPDISVGSSVSSTMENEYNELIQNTFVVPQLHALADLNVPKILENTLGMFSTRLVEANSNKKNEDAESVNNNKNENELDLKELELINSNLAKEKEEENKEVEMTIEKLKASLDLLETTTSDKFNHLQASKFDYLQSITGVTDESSLDQQKKIERFLIHNYSNNDENPRQNSPEPASPPTNLDLDINETSSLDTVVQNTNYQLKSLSSLVANHDKETKVHKSLDLNNNNLANAMSKMEKNVKIASCLDKWYKELKGQVLTEFEKSRLQMLHEQQKKLIEEKEKQTVEIGKLKKELDLVRETVKNYEKRTLKKDAQIDNLTKAVEKQCEKTEVQRTMMEWKLKRVETNRDDLLSKLADKLYNQRLKMRAFLYWHFALVSRQRLKLEKACKKKAEEVCYELASKYEIKIKQLEDELNNSRLEVEKYKIEITKIEENTRKALMRGVCALNMEAMSIFNNESNKSLVNEADQGDLQLNFDINEHLKHMNQEFTKTNAANNISNSLLNEMEAQELNRRVKNYCETSLNKNNPAQTALNKAKQSLLNSNRDSLLTINPNVVSHTKLINSCNKVFSELTEHNIPNKPITTHKQTKSRLSTQATKSSDSISATSSAVSFQSKTSTNSKINVPSQLPAYRSFIIEKHTNNANSNNVQSNTTATRVKYAPPGQPATVLNTVINALAQ